MPSPKRWRVICGWKSTWRRMRSRAKVRDLLPRSSAVYREGMDRYVRLFDNLARIQGQITEAAVLSGRRPEEVRLVGVTKYVDAELARGLVEAGLADLGESRPQELW